jgi:tRNA dimethylallyltransferase
LHLELARLDPDTAARLKPNDSQRIERALEVVRLTGRPLAEVHDQAGEPPPFALFPIALVPSTRTALHARIAQRFDAMLAAGLVDEVRSLRERYALTAEMPAMRCVGYRQVWEFLEGRIDAALMRDQGIFATRQLAKRQLTWLRGTPDLRVVDCLAENAGERVSELAQRVLAGDVPPAAPAPFAW